MWHKLRGWGRQNPGYFALVCIGACATCYAIYCITVISVAMTINAAASRNIVSAATTKFPDLRWSGGHGLEHISIHVGGKVDAQRRHEIESWLQKLKESQRLAPTVYLTYDDEPAKHAGG